MWSGILSHNIKRLGIKFGVAYQAEGREFESRYPLKMKGLTIKWLQGFFY